MKLSFPITFLLLFFYLSPAFSQLPDKHAYLAPEFLAHSSALDQSALAGFPLQGLDSAFTHKNLGIHLFQKDTLWLAWQDCGFNLLVWTDQKWENLYQYHNFGHTCQSQFLWISDKIHLLGGKSEYEYHSDLLELNEQFGSWKLNVVSQQPLHYQSSWIAVTPEGVFSFFGEYFSMRKQLDQLEDEGFFLHFEEKKWEKLSLSWESSEPLPIDAEMLFDIDLKDYSVAVFPDFLLVFEKSSLTIHRVEDQDLKMTTVPDFYWAEDNTFSWQSPQGLLSKKISLVPEKSSILATVKIVPQPDEIIPKIRIQTLSIILIFLALFFVLVFWYYQTSLSKNEVSQDMDQEDKLTDEPTEYDAVCLLIQNLKLSEREFYTTEELDELFEIHTLDSIDNRRVKRARLIKSINDRSQKEWGYTLIMRERQPDDKRYFRYRIVFPVGL